MTNLQKALVANVHPQIDITLLAEIIDATPNTEVATEILCGIYLEPEVPTMVKSSDKKHLYELEKFDKWKNNVHYKYKTPETIGFYIPGGVDENTVTYENYESIKCSGNDKDSKYKRLEVPGKFENKYSNMDLAAWMKLHEASPIDTLAHVFEGDSVALRHAGEVVNG